LLVNPGSPTERDLHSSKASEGRSILIGLGNPAMSDDGIGLLVGREVHKRIPGFDFDESTAGGFDVVDRILGCSRAAIIDSMVTGRHEPGTVVRIEPGAEPATLRTRHSHGVNFVEAIEMARSCGAPVPVDIVIFGIEVEDPFTVGDRISPAVMARLDAIVTAISAEIGEVS
jgi:hydrogenase maturation protease